MQEEFFGSSGGKSRGELRGTLFYDKKELITEEFATVLGGTMMSRFNTTGECRIVAEGPFGKVPRPRRNPVFKPGNLIIALVVILLFLLSIPSLSIGVTVFTTPTQLTFATVGWQYDSRIAVDSGGNSHITWYGTHPTAGGDSQIWYADNTSGAWSAQTQISSTTGGYPQIAVDSGAKSHVVWTGSDEEAEQIWYADNTSGTWSIPTQLTFAIDDNDQYGPRIAVDPNGKSHITWNGPDPTTGGVHQIWYADNASGAWSAPAQLTAATGTNHQRNSRMAVDSGCKSHITWYGKHPTEGGARQIWYADNTSGAWPAPTQLTSAIELNYQQDPEIAVDPSGKSHITWQGPHPTDPDWAPNQIQYTDNVSGTWSEPVQLTSGIDFNNQGSAEIAVDSSGKSHITWYGPDPTTGGVEQIWYADNTSGDWSAPAQLTAATDFNSQYLPKIAVGSSGKSHITWGGPDPTAGGVEQIWYADNTSGTWSAPDQLTSATNDYSQYDPQIALDSNGKSNITWYGAHPTEGEPSQIWYASAVGPTVTGLSPASGINDNSALPVTVQGSDFQNGATLTLTGPDAIGPVATTGSGNTLNATLDLTGKATGTYKATVTNPDMLSGSKDGAFTVSPVPQNKPVIDSVSPPEGPPGTPVTIKGTNFGDARTGAARVEANSFQSYVTFNGVKATRYISWSDTKIVVIVPEGAKTGPVEVVTSAGGSNTDHDFTVDAKPLGSMAWLVAEGSTGEGFDTFILMQNPNNVPAPTAVAFATEDGIQDGTLLEIPANSRMTLRLSEYMPDTWSISTLVAAEVPIVVERSMYWNKDQTAYPYEMKSGHANLGLPAPMQPGFKMDASEDRSTNQYFPEGSTAGFDTWILLFNPMETASQATVTLMDETGPVVEENVSIEPLSRKTVHLNKLLPDANQVATRVESDTFLVAERSMYWDPAASALQPYEMIGGHATAGSPFAANNWYIAEGSTGGGFETFILLQNTADTDAPVTTVFSDMTGTVAQLDTTMPAQSRYTIKVSDYVPDNFQVSTSITSTEPIVAERSMYWDSRETTDASSMKDGHSCIGDMGTGKTWMVAEGSTGGGFDTFVLITNTEDTEATAAVTFMTEAGPQVPLDITMPANSRYTLRINEYLPDTFQVSTLIESDRNLVVERSMYWDNRVISSEGSFPARPFECIGGHSANGLDP